MTSPTVLSPSSSTFCLLAETPEQRDSVYRIRYECYLKSGAIPFDTGQRFSDLFDAKPNHFSFLACSEEDGPLATVRVSVVRPDLSGWGDSPAAKVFGDDPAFQLIASTSYVEANRLCFRPQARRDVFYSLVANMVALADFYETSWLVACPRWRPRPF